MIEALIRAEKECAEEIDIDPDKVLRPIGTVFREWDECLMITELPHWIHWEVIGYSETFKGRRGNVLLYERHEELRSVETDEG